MSTCPTCGERLEATVPVYLRDVVLDAEGRVVDFALDFEWDAEHGGAFAWDHSDVRLYCSNDHDLVFEGIDAERTPRLALTRPVGPPDYLADAWARYRRGEEVTPHELRELDAWRADVREEGNYPAEEER